MPKLSGTEPTNILVAGIGGQGVMTAAEILAQTALNQGYDVKKTEVAGMAQRGGVVTSHVRFGEKVNSPAIPQGEADLLIAFEPAEASRWMGHLKQGGVILANQNEQVPPIVSVGVFDYPDDPIATIKEQGFEVHAFDATAIAKELGNFRLVNTVMLGASSGHLPFSAEVLKQAILARFRERKPELVELNEQAFAAGQAVA
ncbi:MAG: indolepyruvate oxidoreductase subunit beta [Methylococcales bacterium]|nr:indolepyruvate oxidoreductase subunit beta [Methylococcales bacterium]